MMIWFWVGFIIVMYTVWATYFWLIRRHDIQTIMPNQRPAPSPPSGTRTGQSITIKPTAPLEVKDFHGPAADEIVDAINCNAERRKRTFAEAAKHSLTVEDLMAAQQNNETPEEFYKRIVNADAWTLAGTIDRKFAERVAALVGVGDSITPDELRDEALDLLRERTAAMVEEDAIEHGFSDHVLDYSRPMPMAELMRKLKG